MATQHAAQFEFTTGHITTSALMPYGGWCHTIVYRRVWVENGNPNSEIKLVATVLDDEEPTEQHMLLLIAQAPQ